MPTPVWTPPEVSLSDLATQELVYDANGGVSAPRDDREADPIPISLASFGKDVQDWVSGLVEVLLSIYKQEGCWRPSALKLIPPLNNYSRI